MKKNRKNKVVEPFRLGSRVFLTIVFGCLLIVGVGGWASTARLAGAVIAPGEVAVKAKVKQVQHPDGGVVGEILVENGDVVGAGDVLARLDTTQTRAELGVLKSQFNEYQGRAARLVAERDGLPGISFTPGFLESQETAAIAEGEIRLFEQNRDVRKAKVEQLTLQIEQFDQQIAGLRAQRASNESERHIATADLEKLRTLLAKGLKEGAALSTVERDLAKLDGIKGEIDAEIARILGQISETKLKIIELESQTQTTAQKEFRDIDARLSELRERMVAAEDKLSRTEIRAPIAGSVNELAVHTEGGVIAPGQKLMVIVPEGELVVEVNLPTTAIDQVAVGQIARLRFAALNQRTTPEVTGYVKVIGASASVDPTTGHSYFATLIEIVDAKEKLGDVALVPGMPVEVYIQTQERTVASYLVKPIADQVQRAFRED